MVLLLRAEYQVARLETTYLKKGDGWEKAPTVYQISVLDFNYETEDADDPKKADVIRKLADKEAGLMNAQKSLSSISATLILVYSFFFYA